MKLAFAGKGGVGKTTLCAWMGDRLARQGKDVLLVDADTALSLGQACGLSPSELPTPLSDREDLVRERIGSGGFLNMNPDVSDLVDDLCVELPLDRNGSPAAGRKRLLVMGSITGAGDGCACAANALLKAVLAHLVFSQGLWVLVDLEAGVEHLGRGTVADADGLVVVSEPSLRSLETAARVGSLAAGLGLSRQVLVLNRSPDEPALPKIEGLPQTSLHMPVIAELSARQLSTGNVLGLGNAAVDILCDSLLETLDR